MKPDFYFTQFLTGHGNFGEYLKKYKITDDDKCLNCNIEIDTPDHTFQCCSAFREIREKFKITENYSDWFVYKTSTNNAGEYTSIREIMENKVKLN